VSFGQEGARELIREFSIPVPIAIPIPRTKPSAASLPDPTWIDEEPDWPILSARVGIDIGIGIGIENKEQHWHRSRFKSSPGEP
jgi:hypothetical protein